MQTLSDDILYIVFLKKGGRKLGKIFLKLFEWMVCAFVMGILWGTGFDLAAIIIFIIAVTMIFEWGGLMADYPKFISPTWLKFIEGLVCAIIGLICIGSQRYITAGFIILVGFILIAESHERFKSAWYPNQE
jgi:hypothetical protein